VGLFVIYYLGFSDLNMNIYYHDEVIFCNKVKDTTAKVLRAARRKDQWQPT
jgi:hypothetical protein